MMTCMEKLVKGHLSSSLPSPLTFHKWGGYLLEPGGLKGDVYLCVMLPSCILIPPLCSLCRVETTGSQLGWEERSTKWRSWSQHRLHQRHCCGETRHVGPLHWNTPHISKSSGDIWEDHDDFTSESDGLETRDPAHPHNGIFSLLASGKTHCSIRCTTANFYNSFSPEAITLANSQ